VACDQGKRGKCRIPTQKGRKINLVNSLYQWAIQYKVFILDIIGIILISNYTIFILYYFYLFYNFIVIGKKKLIN